MNVSHDTLVEAAKRWLWKEHAVVVTELTSGMETPDAIGWNPRLSTLIECKASRNDFRADGAKFFRRNPEHGMGMRRFYLTPANLITPDELPDRWGLLELHGRRIRTIRESGWFTECSRRREVELFVSLLRRIGKDAPQGVSVKCYTYETKNKATMGVSQAPIHDEPPMEVSS